MSADIRILDALVSDRDAGHESPRVRRMLTGLALSALCAGLVNATWEHVSGDRAADLMLPVLLGGEADQAAVDNSQAFVDARPAAPFPASGATIVTAVPSQVGESAPNRQTAVQIPDMLRQQAKADKTAVIAEAAMPNSKHGVAPVVAPSKPPGSERAKTAGSGRQKTAGGRYKAAPSVPLKASILRAGSKPSSHATRATQIDEPIDPDVQIIEAIVKRSK